MSQSLLARAFNARLGRTIGLFALAAGMAMYRSFSSRTVLGRWSLLFFAALVAVTLLAVTSAVQGWRSSRVPSRVTAAQALFDTGLAVWGIAYLIGALDDSQQGGRLLDANFFGSVAASAAMLEWVAMVVLASALLAWAFSAKGKVWANMLLSMAALAATLLLSEGGSRMWTLGTATTHFGYASRVWQRRFVTRNQYGARDVEHTLQPSPGRRRLLVIGDSYAFGWGVPKIEDRFGEQVSERLAADGTPWESINFSEPDKHTLDEFDFLQRGLRFRPDFVVLVYVFNDMDYLVGITPRPMLAEAPVGIAARFHPARLLFTNSYLFQELYARIRAVSQRRSLRVLSPFRVYDDTALVRRHLADLRRFVAIAESAGAATAIVPIDIGTSVDTATLRRYDQFVAAGKAVGLPMVSIAHAFDGHPVESITVGSLDGHPNALGHHIAAAAATPELALRWREHLAKSPPSTRIETRP
jgi:hypothetical protein